MAEREAHERGVTGPKQELQQQAQRKQASGSSEPGAADTTAMNAFDQILEREVRVVSVHGLCDHTSVPLAAT